METIGLSSVIGTKENNKDGEEEITNNILKHRFDPIGLETDRFFRCTKEISTPMWVHIGETLYNEMEIHESLNMKLCKNLNQTD